ncbi:hypothetical protein ACJW30_06G210700 [Castanea mollissima]
MATLSIVTGQCTRGSEGKDQGFESRSHLDFGKDFFGSYLFRTSSSEANRNWSKAFEGSSIRSRNRFRITAKVKRWKNHDYPWPDLEQNITDVRFSFLELHVNEPSQVTDLKYSVPFIYLLLNLRSFLQVRRMADETGLDFSDQIGSLERKYQQALKDLYTNLTPMQRLTIARHPNRPTVLDYIFNITEKVVYHLRYDDPAIVTGIGSMNGKTYMLIGHQKDRNAKENIAHNFAMPTPHGYLKALHMMKYADHHGFPIVTFIDTPGAFTDLKSEELGQGESIAHNLRTMFGLNVPMVTVVTGEGGSGGALAIACVNKLSMLENSAFYVASPEACAAILWKSSQAAPKTAERLKITAQEHYKLKIADGVIPEPLGGAHTDSVWTSQQIKLAITEAMKELANMDKKELLNHCRLKFWSIGGIQEGIAVDPEKKCNMKPSDDNMPKTADMESELENLKKILEAGPSDHTNIDLIEKHKQDLESIKSELFKAPNPTNQPPRSNLNTNLSQPGAYLGLKYKLGKLNLASRLIEIKEKSDKLKAEINQKIPAEIKGKMELLKKAQENLSKGDSTSKERARGGSQRKPISPSPDLRKKIVDVNKEIEHEIERVIDEAGLRYKLKQLKAESAKGSSSKDIEKLQAEIKERILAALDVTALKEKVDKLRVGLSSSIERVTEGQIGAENGKW